MQDIKGKFKIDFKNQEHVRILTKCLLKKDFDLDVFLPADRLVPTLPLRLNYILWIEDILNEANMHENIKGIDIGTGASCIYCFLASRRNWEMYGLEIDSLNLKIAQENVTRNKLEDRIKIVPQNENDHQFFSKIFETYPDLCSVDFCMVNPPFYSDINEITESKNRTGKRKHPKSEIRGFLTESVCEGGEVQFVKRLVQESLDLKTRIKFYTTMLGHKTSFKKILLTLKEAGIENFRSTQFSQGNTTRWGIAWTFLDFDLRESSSSAANSNSKSKNSVLKYSISNPENKIQFTTVSNSLKSILESIQLKIKVISKKENALEWEVSAYEMSWRNQRRKRRDKARLDGNLEQPEEVVAENFIPENPSLVLGLELSGLENEFLLQIYYIRGEFGKVCAGEVMQFVKNQLTTLFNEK